MAANPARFGASRPTDPVVHELPALRVAGADVPVRLAAWLSDDGLWRGRLVFGPVEADDTPATADIFRGQTEGDLWESVRDLREHHIRDLYRSIVE